MSTGSDIVSALTPTINIAPGIPGEEFAAAFAAMLRLGDDLLLIFNSPAMQAARKNVDIQKALDKIAQNASNALNTGDVTNVEKDLS